MATLRCPLDDKIFDTVIDHKHPHHVHGHPDCPGPMCRAIHDRNQTPEALIRKQRAIVDANKKAAEEAAVLAERQELELERMISESRKRAAEDSKLRSEEGRAIAAEEVDAERDKVETA